MEFRRLLWASPLLAIVILGVFYIVVGEPGFPYRPFFLLLLLAAFVAMAVITPITIFTQEKTNLSSWYPLILALFCALVLLCRFILAGSIETYGGREYPHFGYRFPILGSILDFIVISAGIRGIAYYPPGYEIILWAGLFIETMLVSAIIYTIFSSRFLQDKSPGSPGIFPLMLISTIIIFPWMVTELEYYLWGGDVGPRPWDMLSIFALLATIFIPIIYGWKTLDTRGAVIIGVVPFLFAITIPRVLFGVHTLDAISLGRSVLAIVSLCAISGLSGYFSSLHEKRWVVVMVTIAGVWAVIYHAGIN